MITSRYIISFLCCSLFTSLPALATPLSDYEWQKRPLLLFATSASSQQLQQTLDILEEKQCELNDREMIIGIILQQGNSLLNNQTLSPNAAARLRDDYAINTEPFVVILLGKDGGEKYRSKQIPAMTDIFQLIDGMPMRQNEMEDKASPCR